MIALVAWFALGCGAAEPASQAGPPPIEPVAPEAAAPGPVRITLAAVGDVLPHRRVKASAAAQGWLFVFGEAVPLLRSADLAFANLESPVAPDHHTGVHGEVFNAPADLLPGLAAAGIDVVSVANNHAYDQGADGVLETLTRARQAGIEAVGAGADCAAARAPVILERSGVRVAFVAATDLSNLDGNRGEDDPCVFSAGAVCTGACGPDRDAVHFGLDTERLVAVVERARAEADFVVWSFHWGDEFRTVPLPEYPELARVLTDAGVNVLLGHHPHVLQPISTRTTRDGRTAVIAYSLGNFVSNMGEDFDPAVSAASRGNVRDAVVLSVGLVRHPDGRTEIEAPRATPLWTENTPDHVRVRTHAALSADPALVAARRAQIQTILGATILDP